jgi:pectinesterase
MGWKIFSIATLSFLFLIPFFAFLATANDILVPQETICESSHYPSYCRNILPKQKAKVHDFARFSIQKSMFQSHKFFNSLKFYLGSSTLSKETINVLKDCLFLSQLTSQYLSKSNYIALKNTNDTIYTSQVDDTQTLLSAVITNHQTCLDGLMTVANSNLTIKNYLISQLSNDNKLHSVSLALFTKGWMHEKKNKTLWNSRGWHYGNFRNGRLPLKMSNRTRAIYDSSRGRGKTHDDDHDDDDEGGVLVRDIVVVSKDGSGNFTTINDAVAAAPNNTINATNGYFLIFIKEGVYEEYVSIPQNKAYLMMIGDGINQTVITGNHSVGDGWTTFNSPTFGKKTFFFFTFFIISTLPCFEKNSSHIKKRRIPKKEIVKVCHLSL